MATALRTCATPTRAGQVGTKLGAHVVRAALSSASLALLATFATPSAGVAQAPRVANANWALADNFDTEKLRPFVYSTSVTPGWINDTDSLWYSFRDSRGVRFELVIPKTRTRRPLFDHVHMAELLSAEVRKPVEPANLPITRLTFTDDSRAIRFRVDSLRFEYDLAAATIKRVPPGEDEEEEPPVGRGGRGGGGGGGFQGGRGRGDFRNFSPDSTAYVYAREHNLYYVEASNEDAPIQITTDGVEYYSFGNRDTTDVQEDDDDEDDDEQQQTGQRRGRQARDPRVRANVTWSPDSRTFYVTRNDSREVGDLYLVDVLADPRPTLRSYKYAMPGEEKVAQVELWTFDRAARKLTTVDVKRFKDQRLFDIHWTTGSDRLRLVRRDRLQRNLELIEVDLATGGIRSLITESVENAFLERQNVRYVKGGGDMIWWSERTGWGHYYLYDHDGNLKRPVTAGPWRAESIAEVDSVKRVLYFRAVGKEPDENAYYRHTYRTGLDGGASALLDPGDADHNSSISPSKKYAVDTYSRVDQPPVAVLRDERGQVILELEQMDVSKLAEMGWRPPERFTVKAADGITDIYGNMWLPFDFDPNRKYPIIAHVYPGPQQENVSTTFSATAAPQRLAQLGFVVIQIGNRGGSPRRSNAYHSFGYYNLRDYGLADKKAGIEQLAARHPWIDISRVGIFGHSGGGFMTAAALLLPPYNDFFKVGVSSAGNHDNNVYNQNWSEQHHGLREVTAERTVTDGNNGNDGDQSGEAVQEEMHFEIEVPANHELAANLKGRLLLVHGDMDNNVHPAGTIRLVNALIKADKRFDLMILPGKAHGFADMQGYFNRMMYEYFAEHLMGDYYRNDAELSGR
jgi:dipeptidyl-peptidase 4